MKESIQNTIDKIKSVAATSTAVPVAKATIGQQRPDNMLSRSIRNEKEAAEFKARLKAAVELSKIE